VKKIEVALSARRLNAEAQRRESERIAAEREEAIGVSRSASSRVPQRSRPTASSGSSKKP
jgi:hypothetical protein